MPDLTVELEYRNASIQSAVDISVALFLGESWQSINRYWILNATAYGSPRFGGQYHDKVYRALSLAKFINGCHMPETE